MAGGIGHREPTAGGGQPEFGGAGRAPGACRLILGAAGGSELIPSVGAIREAIVPPTINVDNLDPEADIDICANEARPAKVKAALSNSFGFGGHNASLLIKAYEG